MPMDNNPTATEGGSSSAPPPPPWIELPRDLTENILSRLGPAEILENAQKVCTTWRSACSEPLMWRVIDMKIPSEISLPDVDEEEERFQSFKQSFNIMCRRAVDRSQGELVDINIQCFGTDDLLHYISEQSNRLKRLRLEYCYFFGLTASVKNFPELEELHLFCMPYSITARDIEAISISCPKLKSFTFVKLLCTSVVDIDDSCALTIAKNMPNLCHLCLLGDRMSHKGLKAILVGCPNLVSLDFRLCFSVDLRWDFSRICSERIKYLKHPSYSTEDYEWRDMSPRCLIL